MSGQTNLYMVHNVEKKFAVTVRLGKMLCDYLSLSLLFVNFGLNLLGDNTFVIE